MSFSSHDIAISARGLNKSYSIAHQSAKHSTFAEAILHRARHPFRREELETFHALKEVSFEIKKGEVVGIIGRNGAGKSTLLKILSRITEPTSGEIDLYGRVGSLLEVGTGFHPELTGRENIFLNGAILGMRRAEIRKQFDAIVDFSGCETFIDTPVKRYSSGMYVRLAFAVAAHLESEILIVDEVLAVGDTEFQSKCLGKMKDVANSGRTVLFVSHNMQAIQSLCSGAILLTKGSLEAAGSMPAVTARYLALGSGSDSSWQAGEVAAEKKAYFEQIDCALHEISPKLELCVTCKIQSRSPHADAFLAIDVSDCLGQVIMQALPTLRGFVRSRESSRTVDVTIDLPPLIPGRYSLTVWLGPHNAETFDIVRDCVSFEVTETPTPGRTFPHTHDHGRIVPASRASVMTSPSPIQNTVYELENAR